MMKDEQVSLKENQSSLGVYLKVVHKKHKVDHFQAFITNLYTDFYSV